MRLCLCGIAVIVGLGLTGCDIEDVNQFCMDLASGNVDSQFQLLGAGYFQCSTPPPTCTYQYGCGGGQSAPLLFEENRGQGPREAQFMARNRTFALLMEEQELVLLPRDGADAVRLRLESTLETSLVEGAEPQPGLVNYLTGNNPKRWHRGIQSYRKVLYRGVYPGIDVAYYGNSERVENDFILLPGAKPESIRIGIEGVKELHLDAHGDLVVNAGSGTLTWAHPRVYQRRRNMMLTIEAGYVLLDRTHVGFRLGAYDPEFPVVIDPVLTYSTMLGAGGNDSGKQVAVDAAGNVYVTGYTTSTKLPVTAAGVQPAAGGAVAGASLSSGDAFVMKFNSQTNQLVYLTYLGGSRSDVGLGIAVDGGGNAYVTGMTESADFPTTAGAVQRQYGSTMNANSTTAGDAFVAKLSPDGSQLVYSTYLGGNQRDGGWAIAVDSGGNAYMTGQTLSPNFPVTAAAFQNSFRWAGISFNMAGLAFVAKLNPTGSSLLYATYLGGTGDNRGLGMAVDASGSAYVTGSTTSRNFPVTAGSFQTSFGGSSGQPSFFGDAFVAKLNPGGSGLVYATYLGGTGEDVGTAIAVDSGGFAYVAGMTLSRNFPTTAGAARTAFAGTGAVNPFPAGDAFVAKINPAGTGLVYSTYVGGGSDDAATAVAIDAAGEAAITGFTLSKDFPVTADARQSNYAGAGGQYAMQTGDAFVAKLNASGSALLYSTYLGGSGDDAGLGIAMDSGGAISVAGSTVSPDFPATMNALQGRYGGAESGRGLPRGDLFLARLGNAVVTPPPQAKPTPMITGVRSASEFGALPRIAPGSWVEISGTHLAADARLWSDGDFHGAQAPTALDGTSVAVGGEPAVISGISGGQVNAQVPFDTGTGAQQLTVMNANGASNPFAVAIDPVAPGLFAPAALRIGGKQYVQALLNDGTYVLPVGAVPGITSRPAQPGETIVMVGVGFGPVTPGVSPGQVVQQTNQLNNPIQILFGQMPATVAYAGLAPRSVGLYQFNVIVPLVDDSDAVPLTFMVGEVAGAQTLYTAVRQTAP